MKSRLVAVLAVAVIALGALEAGVGPAGAAADTTPRPAAGAADGYPAGCPWMNTRLSADQRARLLLSASTLDQKIRWLDEQAANNPAQTTFGGVTYPAQVPCTPTVVYADGPDFVRRAAGVTIYPSQIDLAATWSTRLAYAKGKAEAHDAFNAGRNVILGPGINSARTPLDGRIPEFLGEDSLLSGDLAAAGINGLQHGNPGEPVMAVLKHYVANEQEFDRTHSSSNLNTRTMQEVYNLPFAIALSESTPGGVMCSYNQVNGVYMCQNPLLTTTLKSEDGLGGYVVSDFGAVHSTVPSLNAGLDQELNRPVYYTPANIVAALSSGQVTMAEINEAAFRVVHAYIEAGLFDHPLPSAPSASPADAATRAVAERIAERGSVLLKNDGGILPLGAASGSIAVIGPTASSTPANGVSAETVCAQLRPDGMNNATLCPNVVAPLDAITSRAARDGVSVSYNDGSDLVAAAAAAKSAKVAIVFGYAMQGEGADRTTLALDGNGDALISAVAAANPNTIVILETGSATTMPWLSKVKGVIEAWYPGEQQGTALARLLFGDANFSGRLPITFPASLAETPANTQAQYPGIVPAGSGIDQVSYSEGLAVGYKWYEAHGIKPLFPFGYGLSYTSFSYSHLTVTPRINGRSPVVVGFDIRNDGDRAGTATPQVYLTLPAATGEPGRRLAGFRPVTLRPGQRARVTVTIDPGSAAHPFSYWDSAASDWAIAPGRYLVQVGSSSQDLPLTATSHAGIR